MCLAGGWGDRIKVYRRHLNKSLLHDVIKINGRGSNIAVTHYNKNDFNYQACFPLIRYDDTISVIPLKSVIMNGFV